MILSCPSCNHVFIESGKLWPVLRICHCSASFIAPSPCIQRWDGFSTNSISICPNHGSDLLSGVILLIIATTVDQLNPGVGTNARQCCPILLRAPFIRLGSIFGADTGIPTKEIPSLFTPLFIYLSQYLFQVTTGQYQPPHSALTLFVQSWPLPCSPMA
jgi:hypothetical protein